MAYVNQYQRKKSIAFGKAFDQYELYKSELRDQLERGKITHKEYEMKIRQKVRELNL